MKSPEKGVLSGESAVNEQADGAQVEYPGQMGRAASERSTRGPRHNVPVPIVDGHEVAAGLLNQAHPGTFTRGDDITKRVRHVSKFGSVLGFAEIGVTQASKVIGLPSS